MANQMSAAAAPKLIGKKVLVVDDNMINLDVAVEAFSMAGAHVDSAAEGSEAISLIERSGRRAFQRIVQGKAVPDDGLERSQCGGARR